MVVTMTMANVNLHKDNNQNEHKNQEIYIQKKTNKKSNHTACRVLSHVVINQVADVNGHIALVLVRHVFVLPDEISDGVIVPVTHSPPLHEQVDAQAGSKDASPSRHRETLAWFGFELFEPFVPIVFRTLQVCGFGTPILDYGLDSRGGVVFSLLVHFRSAL